MKHIPKLEIPALLLFVVGLILMKLNGSSMLLGLGFGTLATVYFLNALIPPESSDSPNHDQETPEAQSQDFKTLLVTSILPKVLWISCSVGIVGIQFQLQNYPGARIMLGLGCNTILVATFISIFLRKEQEAGKVYRILWRAIPIAIICFYFMYQLGAFQ